MSMRLIHLIRVSMLFCWPAVAYAGSVTLGQNLGALGWEDIAAVVGLSLFSGTVALLERIEREAKLPLPHIVPKKLHMSAAMLAGFMAFLLAEIADLSYLQETLSIIVASWSGAAYVTRIVAATKPEGRL